MVKRKLLLAAIGFVCAAMCPGQATAVEVVGHQTPDQYQSVTVERIVRPTGADFVPGQIGLANSVAIHGDTLVETDLPQSRRPPPFC